MVVSVQIAPLDFDRVFAALADHTRRDIVRRAISAEEGVLELASHYPISFAAVQKHVAILERAGLITKERAGRRKVVRTNIEGLRLARGLLDDLPIKDVPRFAAELLEHFRGSAIGLRNDLAAGQAFNATLEEKFKKEIGEFKTNWVAVNVKK